MVPYATRIGIIGLIIWSASALFNSIAAALPTFEILTFALGLGFLAGSVYLTFNKSWHKLKQNSIFTFLGFLGVFGNEFFFVSAFKMAPAAHITLINYLWPIIVVACLSSMPKQEFCLRTILAAIIGFVSVAYIIIQDSITQFNPQYYLGYLFVVLGTMMWSIYIIVNRRACAIPSEMITLYCGIGAVISLIMHLFTESFIIPDVQQTIALLWLGVMSMCVAFKCWNFGTLHGNIGLLSVLSYNNVLISTILLMLFNNAGFNPHLIISVFGLMLASLLSCCELRVIKEKYQQILKSRFSP